MIIQHSRCGAARACAVVFGLGAVVSALCGCEILIGIHERSASPDASTQPSACTLTVPPEEPDAGDGTSTPGLVFAFQSLDLGVLLDGGVRAPIGYNLDGQCGCPRTGTCAPNVVAGMSGAPVCDPVGGIEDSLGGVFQTFAELSSGTYDANVYTSEIQAGNYGFLLQLQNYDGQPDDPQVTVGVFPSDGTAPSAGAAGAADSGAHPVPRWDGTDVWTLDAPYVLNATGGASAVPGLFDVSAYVTGGVLVSHVNFPIRLYGGAADGDGLMQGMRGMALTAQIASDGAGGWLLRDGVIAGRWPTANLGSGMSGLTMGDAGFVCPGTQEYDFLSSAVCAAADVPIDPDSQDAAAPCDALSFGMRFQAAPAQLGPIATWPPSASPCADAGPISCN